MNREEAAKELKISVRSLQRTVKAGRLSVSYKRGVSGKQEALFDADEIARYKQEMVAETVKPAVATTRDNTALARSVAPQVSALFDLLGQAAQTRSEPTLSDLAVKPILTLHEASRFSSFSRRALLDAHQAGRLKLFKAGRGWKVKRSDLLAWCESF